MAEDLHLRLRRALAQPAGLGDGPEDRDLVAVLELVAAGALHSAVDIDRHLLLDRRVNDIARLNEDVRRGVAAVDQLLELDGDPVRGAPGHVPDDVHGSPDIFREPACLGHDVEQRLAAEQLERGRVLDGAAHGDLPAVVLLDEDRDLGILHVLVVEKRRDLLLERHPGHAADLDASHEREGDRAVVGHTDGPAELLDVEHGDLEKVVGPEDLEARRGRDQLGMAGDRTALDGCTGIPGERRRSSCGRGEKQCGGQKENCAGHQKMVSTPVVTRSSRSFRPGTELVRRRCATRRVITVRPLSFVRRPARKVRMISFLDPSEEAWVEGSETG